MEISKHYGHEIVVARYTDPSTDTPVNYSVECMDCYEVIVDEEAK